MSEISESCSCGVDFTVLGDDTFCASRYVEFLNAHMICRESYSKKNDGDDDEKEDEEKMKCPYCSKENFIPDVVSRNIEAYGSDMSNFKCLHCKKIVKVFGHRIVRFGEPKKTDADSDW